MSEYGINSDKFNKYCINSGIHFMTLQSVKNNLGKIVFGSASSIIAIVAALFAIDARYAHAEDVQRTKIETQQLIQETSKTLRKQMIEDRLFELDFKKAQSRDQKLPPMESAVRERYQRQLDELQK
jgi:hypothetical protein